MRKILHITYEFAIGENPSEVSAKTLEIEGETTEGEELYRNITIQDSSWDVAYEIAEDETYEHALFMAVSALKKFAQSVSKDVSKVASKYFEVQLNKMKDDEEE